MKKLIGIILIVLFNLASNGFAATGSKPGFLVLVPDRGFVGNKETNALFDQFKNEYTASLAIVGKNYNGMGSEYSGYIQDALSKLVEQGVSNIVVLPLFLSDSNPVLKKVKTHLSNYTDLSKVEWGTPMSKSYLISQILLDRVSDISQNPEQERLIILGMGAVDEKSENLIKKELKNFTNYVQARKHFQKIETAVYYTRGAEEKLREQKNGEVDNMIIHSSAKKGNTLLVPFFIGPKFSHQMSLTHWVDEKFKDLDLTYSSQAILPHSNVLTWMKKMANQHMPVRKDQVGVVIMPHGATQPYNDAIEKAVEPLKKDYKVEMAYGMADPITIENAVLKLEKQGAKRIVFVRMYSMSGQFKDKTDYILGLRNDLPNGWQGQVPSQVRTSVAFNTFGGYEEDVLTAEILLDRIKEVSQDPEKETVILLAHGSEEDHADQAWRDAMKTNIDWIKKQVSSPFKKITGMTLREDWPEKRTTALDEIRKVIEEGNESGKVLIISNRLYGSGPYKHFLRKLKFDMNGKGFAPHPNLTRWLEKGIKASIEKGFPPVIGETRISQKPQAPSTKVALASN